ncbi:hypothetical protein ACFU5O_18005 [Streptomyces sp. NPDC057445]|uniref:hypothetical protein n=1 Tax=Streptomyces sp. NPDC057445 TaxID=3346136 RepID=UPI00367520B9
MTDPACHFFGDSSLLGRVALSRGRLESDCTVRSGPANAMGMSIALPDHGGMPLEQPISTLSLRHIVPDPDAWSHWVQVRAFIDGRDVVKEVHPEGLAGCHDEWAGPAQVWPLAATEDPRRIVLSEPDCTPGCCGALYVTIRRQGDRVIWSSWKNTSSINSLPATDFHFDATQYDAELARAAADLSWEQPVDTVARILTRTFADSGWFARWDCVLEDVDPCP